MDFQFRIREALRDACEALFELHVALFKEQIRQLWGWDKEWQPANFSKEWAVSRARTIESGGG